jgi:ribonuclease VapC
VIVVDSSAVVAIVRAEPDAPRFVAILDGAGGAAMSAVSLVETTIVVIGRRLGSDVRQIRSFIQCMSIEVADVTAQQAALAIDAFVAFGKGRHPAALNLADCFSYALAKSRNAPLLYKGGDFARTDIEPAWRP